MEFPQMDWSALIGYLLPLASTLLRSHLKRLALYLADHLQPWSQAEC